MLTLVMITIATSAGADYCADVEMGGRTVRVCCVDAHDTVECTYYDDREAEGE